MNRLRVIGVVGSAAAAVGVAVVLSIPHHASSAGGTRASTPAAEADIRQAAQISPSSLNPATAASAQRYVGLTLVDAPASDMEALPAASERTALASANAYNSDGTLARVSLVRATKAGTDTAEAAKLKLRHINQLAWALEYTDAKQPLFGPVDGAPHTKSATLILLLDPFDGSFISATYF